MSKRKLMVVDDEDTITHILSELFLKNDYIVTTAASGEEALELLYKEVSHVFILDLKLPGMNGVELCKKIKANYPMAVVIALTGYASLFELSDCREAGFEDYLTKPVKLQFILDLVDRAFEKIERWKKNE